MAMLKGEVAVRADDKSYIPKLNDGRYGYP